MKLKIPQENQIKVIIDLLINIKAEQEAIRNVFATIWVEKSGENINDLNADFVSARQEALQTIVAQIQAHYGGLGSADDLINSAFS